MHIMHLNAALGGLRPMGEEEEESHLIKRPIGEGRPSADSRRGILQSDEARHKLVRWPR